VAHILLRLTTPSLTPIGTIRGTRSEKDGVYYKLSRLAVLKPYRQFKFGRVLVHGLHDWIKADAKERMPAESQEQSVKVITHSQIPVKGFYAKYVWTGPHDTGN
jgi:hypothetical protein